MRHLITGQMPQAASGVVNNMRVADSLEGLKVRVHGNRLIISYERGGREVSVESIVNTVDDGLPEGYDMQVTQQPHDADQNDITRALRVVQMAPSGRGITDRVWETRAFIGTVIEAEVCCMLAAKVHAVNAEAQNGAIELRDGALNQMPDWAWPLKLEGHPKAEAIAACRIVTTRKRDGVEDDEKPEVVRHKIFATCGHYKLRDIEDGAHPHQLLFYPPDRLLDALGLVDEDYDIVGGTPEEELSNWG